MSSTSEIIVVSGLPRSGTSLMMQMLEAGGWEIVTDGIREADRDNPRGYCELEKIKQVKKDAAWLPETRGKVVKAISQLLYDLPATEKYRVIFMERDLEEVLTSQEKMLTRLGRPTAPRDQIRQAFQIHLKKFNEWVTRQPHLSLMRIAYADLLSDPQSGAEQVNEFIGGGGDIEKMVSAVDPTLYRNRATATS